MGMVEIIVVPAILYGCKGWAIGEDVQRRLDVLELKF